eukprot:2285655-Rhodomonas_salina.1
MKHLVRPVAIQVQCSFRARASRQAPGADGADDGGSGWSSAQRQRRCCCRWASSTTASSPTSSAPSFGCPLPLLPRACSMLGWR